MTKADASALRDPAPLWPWLRGFLIAYAALAIALAAASTGFYLISGGDPNYYPLDSFGQIVTVAFAGTGLLIFIIYIVCVVLTCRATYRMMRNLRAIGSNYVSISPGWAVGWYFIPFANLVMPQRAVAEIWRGTFWETSGDGPPREPNGMIARWWSCWLGGNVCDNVGSRLMGETFFAEPVQPTPEMLTAGLIVWGVGAVLGVLACVFMIQLFGALTRAQTQMVNVAAFR